MDGGARLTKSPTREKFIEFALAGPVARCGSVCSTVAPSTAAPTIELTLHPFLYCFFSQYTLCTFLDQSNSSNFVMSGIGPIISGPPRSNVVRAARGVVAGLMLLVCRPSSLVSAAYSSPPNGTLVS